MDAIASGLGSKEIERITLHESFHVLTLDVERDRVFAAVTDWLGRH
jgi:esterase/lipase